MCEQSDPRDLVRDAVRAEQAGFDFEVISDHYSPWLVSQGHAPNAWATLGAIAHATHRVDLMTYVTCPIMRYHPAVVAQQAATVGLLSEGRFLLGLGAGENLNEHVVGWGWPAANVRHEMLEEALEIIRGLFGGGYVDFVGDHFRVDSAKLWDLGDEPPRVGLAVSGQQSVRLAGEWADAMIAVEPEAELGEMFVRPAAPASRASGRCRSAGIRRVTPRSTGRMISSAGSARLEGECGASRTAGFAAASQFVRKADVADAIPCGPDLEGHVEAVREFVKAGFTDVAVVQVGGESQPAFLDWAQRELVPALRDL